VFKYVRLLVVILSSQFHNLDYFKFKPTLESTNVRDVFACGDVCHIVSDPRPKAGVFAVRAGYAKPFLAIGSYALFYSYTSMICFLL